jgi:hypothetical protein
VRRGLAATGVLATALAGAGIATAANASTSAGVPRSAGAAASAPRCQTADLAAHLRQLNPSAGNRHAVLSLENTSGRTCHTRGHIGMRLRDSTGKALPTKAVWVGGGGSTVTIKPGHRAYTRLDWGVVPSGNEPVTGRCEPTPARLAVTPPDERTQRTLTWSNGPVCGHGAIDSQPLRAGSGPAY